MDFADGDKIATSDAETVVPSDSDESSCENDGTLAKFIHCNFLLSLWTLFLPSLLFMQIQFSTFSGDIVLRASSDFDSFARLCLPLCHVDHLPHALRMDKPFRIRYGKLAVLVRRGFSARLVHKHFQELELWPLGLLLTAEGPKKRQKVN